MPPFSATVVLSCAALSAQTPAAEADGGAEVLATLDGRAITLAEYRDFLWRRFGTRALPQYADQLRVERACARYGVEADAEELERLVAERIEQARRGRSEEEFADEMRRGGGSLEQMRRNARAEMRQMLLLDGLVRATRVATDARLRQAFERRHGPGGTRVTVRHVLVMPHFLRAERVRAGTPAGEIDQQEMDRLAREQAEECLRRLEEGASLEELVPEYSHDQVTRDQDGILPSYRPGLYGPAFTAAVQSLQPGEHSGVIQSGAGYHVVELVDRESTDFAAVREQLVREVLEAEPTWEERERLLQSLRHEMPLRYGEASGGEKAR